jgi:preprotein translocase subunit SecE
MMFGKIKSFFQEVKVEAKKVNYPSREELIGSTWVVITTVIIVSIFLGVVDMSLAKVVKFLVR